MYRFHYILCFSTRSLMDRTEASDAFNAGSIPVGCIIIAFYRMKGYYVLGRMR